MPNRKTKFSSAWLEKTDENGHHIKSWCEERPKDVFSAFCKMCEKTFSVANMGFGQLLSHANSSKHKVRMSGRSNQSLLVAEKSSSSGSSVMQLSISSCCKHWVPANMKEKTLRAETMILLTAIKCNYSFASMSELGCVFADAFEDSQIAKNFKLADTKSRYVVKFGLAPYFKSQFFKDLSSSNSFFSIYFDETTTKQVKKQLDVYVSYWSAKFGKVNTVYCDSFFLGHCEADKILKIMLDFLENNDLKISKLLQCSMDGPKVNLAFQRQLNAHLHTLDLESLIDIGTCSLHTMHNAMKKGLSELNCDVESLCVSIFQWFKSAARREDFHNAQLSLLVDSAADHFFQRHVESRWLTLGPVCERIIEQYEVLKEYFLHFLPKKNVKATDNYIKIVNFLKDPLTLIYLHFIVFFCSLFTQYIKLFQRETPLIHIIYNKQNELLRSIMFKFLKSEVLKNSNGKTEKEGLSLCNVDCDDAKNWMLLKKIDVGTGARSLLEYEVHKSFLHDVRNAFCGTCKYLQSKLPLSNPILHDLQFILPSHQKNCKSKEAISRLSGHLLKVTKNIAVRDIINSEYLLYMCEDLQKEQELFSSNYDICSYWNAVSQIKESSGNLKYPNLTYLIKSCLTLSHGNAIPERGFSLNNRIVTSERASLSELGIKSLRICKDFLKNQEISTSLITKEMINFIEKSHASYASYVEQLKNEQKKAAIKRKIEEDEQEAMEVKRREKESLKDKKANFREEESRLLMDEEAARNLLNEASEKLSTAVKNDDRQNIKIAQMMIDTANQTIKNVSEKLKGNRQNMLKIEKKFNDLQ